MQAKIYEHDAVAYADGKPDREIKTGCVRFCDSDSPDTYIDIRPLQGGGVELISFSLVSANAIEISPICANVIRVRIPQKGSP